MKCITRKIVHGVAVAAVATLCIGWNATQAQAGQVITSGPVSMGIFDEGHLGFDRVGLNLAGVGDAIIPGCLCEGWGVAGNGVAGYANVSEDGGPNNLVVDSFTGTAST